MGENSFYKYVSLVGTKDTINATAIILFFEKNYNTAATCKNRSTSQSQAELLPTLFHQNKGDGRDKGLHVLVCLNHKIMPFIIDTGVSIIPITLLSKKAKLESNCMKLIGASGSVFKTVGNVSLHFSIGGIIFQHTFMVVDVSVSPILGLFTIT